MKPLPHRVRRVSRVNRWEFPASCNIAARHESAAERHHRALARTGDLCPSWEPASRRLGRARHQDRAPGQRRLRAWVRRDHARLVQPVRVGESIPGRQALDALLERADVFIQNLAPGAAAKLGLDAQTLVRRRPRLIACDVSGYGADGPYSDKKAYDLLVQCE